jgi:hypothetical protein
MTVNLYFSYTQKQQPSCSYHILCSSMCTPPTDSSSVTLICWTVINCLLYNCSKFSGWLYFMFRCGRWPCQPPKHCASIVQQTMDKTKRGMYLNTTHHACNETNLMHYLSSVYSFICLSWLSVGLAHRQSTKMYNMYQLLHIYIATSWWWVASKSETCRGIVTE